MNELIVVGILLAAVVGGLVALAPRLSESLVSSRARRLPHALSARMNEEWLAELAMLPSRLSQLAFAIALTLTRRRSFAIDDDTLFAAPARSPLGLAQFGSSPSVVAFTTIVAAALAYGGSFLIPPLYRSQTVVIVVPPRVASQFVKPAVSMSLEQRLRAIRSTAFSRRRLEEIILHFDLYQPDGARQSVDDAAIERMREDIEVHADGQFVEISYRAPDPRLAMKVTERVMSLVIEAHLEDREAVGDMSRKFLDAQVAEVRSRLLKRGDTTFATDPAEADVHALEHESLRTTYRDLLMKREQAIILTSLERRQMIEQFKLLEPARIPEAPVSPNRPRLALIGGLVGFWLGIAMMLGGRLRSWKRSKKVLAQS